MISITVSQGTFNGSIPARSAVAIHTGVVASSSKSAAVTFKHIASTGFIGSIVVAIFLQSLLIFY
jgi:hypothetical protein